MIMGFMAGIFCYLMCTRIKNKFGYDDSLDVFGIHGMGGTLGALLSGVFAANAVGGVSGVLEGNPAQMIVQGVSIIGAIGISVVVTFILLKVLDATMKLRVSEEGEIRGLDISEHGEEGYIFQ
jgi:Amt family ammonium transporter